MFFESIFKLAMFFISRKKYKKAKILLYICFLDISIRNESVLNLSYILQFEENKYDYALKILNKELKRKYDEDIEYQIGFFYSLKKDYKNAINIFEKLLNNQLLKNEKINIQIITILIDLYNETKEFKKANEIFEIYKKKSNLIKIDRNNYLFYNYGNTFLGLKKYDKAIEYYNKSLKYPNEEEFKTIYNIGMCYYKMKNFKKSLDFYYKSLSLINSNNKFAIAKTEFAIGNVYYKLNDLESSKIYFEKSARNGYELAIENLEEVNKIIKKQ